LVPLPPLRVAFVPKVGVLGPLVWWSPASYVEAVPIVTTVAVVSSAPSAKPVSKPPFI
jgi:hypothetical protein